MQFSIARVIRVVWSLINFGRYSQSDEKSRLCTRWTDGSAHLRAIVSNVAQLDELVRLIVDASRQIVAAQQ